MRLIILVLLITFPVSLLADSIPGFIDVDFSTGRYYERTSDSVIGMLEGKFAYGFEYKWIRPYTFVGWKTFFHPNKLSSNFPYRDLYDFGITIEFKKMFYVTYSHRCSHAVYTESNTDYRFYAGNQRNFLLFEGWPTLSYDMIIVGIKTTID